MLLFEPKEYQNTILMSNRKHLLVEGVDDKHYFKCLMDQLYGEQWIRELELDIDTAEQIRSDDSGPEGNRKKVENISSNIEHEEYARRFVGFVDREFRGFNLETPNLIDNIESHFVTGRMVWSRGHSIENYLFEFSLLKTVLIDLTNFDKMEPILLFEKLFESIIRLACTISLVAFENGNIDRLKSSINWKNLILCEDNLYIREENWKQNLSRRFPENTEEIIASFYKWDEKVRASEYNVVKWLCHGHIGFSFIWWALANCADKFEENPEKVFSTQDSIRMKLCVRRWSESLQRSEPNYPQEVLRMLELT